MHNLLEQNDVNSQELATLLQDREQGKADFILVDVREQFEYDNNHIKGVDTLKPTSEFQEWAEELLNNTKDKTLIFTCRTGSRSSQVQRIFLQNGHPSAINHFGGIVTYSGDLEN